MAQGFARSSAFNVIAGLCTTFGGFLSTVLVARMLGVEGAGVVAFATWIVTVVVVLGDLGVPGAMARYLPEIRARGDDAAAEGLARFLLHRYGLALGISAIGFAAYTIWVAFAYPDPGPLSGSNYREVWLFWALVGLACLSQGLAAFTNGYLKGREAFRRLARLAVISATLQIATTIAGIWLFGIAGAMLAAIIGFLVPAALVFLTVAPRKPTPIRADLKKRVTRFAWEAWGGYIVTAFAWSRMEIFFLERSWGSEAAGLFSVSLTLTNLASQAPVLLTGALLPFLARHAGRETEYKAREAYAVGARLMAFLVFPACIGMAAISSKLLPTIFGADFAPAVPTTMILLAAAAFSATASVTTVYLLAMERTRVVFVTGALGAVLAVIVGLVAVPLYGGIAAALGRSLIQLLVVAVAVWYVDRRLHCRTPFAALARIFIAASLSGGAAYLVVEAIDNAAALPAAILAGICVYLAATKLLAPLPAGDVDHLIGALSMLPGSLARPVAALLRALRPAA